MNGAVMNGEVMRCSMAWHTSKGAAVLPRHTAPRAGYDDTLDGFRHTPRRLHMLPNAGGARVAKDERSQINSGSDSGSDSDFSSSAEASAGSGEWERRRERERDNESIKNTMAPWADSLTFDRSVGHSYGAPYDYENLLDNGEFAQIAHMEFSGNITPVEFQELCIERFGPLSTHDEYPRSLILISLSLSFSLSHCLSL